MLTLADLLQSPTLESLQGRLLGLLQGKGFPITDWLAGGAYRTLARLQAEALLEHLGKLVPKIVAGGLLDLADDQWVDLVGFYLYGLTRNAATSTIGTVVLTCSPAAGPYNITAGQLWLIGAGGNRYRNTSGGVLPAGGTLSITVESEGTNDSANGVNFNDGAGTITRMLTPLPGVTCSNPAPTYSPVVLAGTSTGTVTPSGANPTASTWTVRIDTNGQAGVASWSYSRDGGAWVSAGAVAALPNVEGTNITITLANGAGVPSFLAGDRFSFSAPGTWITQAGTDRETRANYITRCKARWPSLAAVPTADVYELWARQASTQVTRVLVRTFTGVAAGQVDVYVAGQNGTLPAPVLALVSAYIQQRHALTDVPVVQSPTNRAVVLAGTVKCKAAAIPAAKVAAQQLVANYITLDVVINGKILWAQVLEHLMAPDGVVDVPRNLLTISVGGGGAVAADGDLSTFPGQNVATFSQDLATALTWEAV